MKLGLFIRLFLCVLALGGALYVHINKQNKITKLRLEIPKLIRKVRTIEEENTRLQFEIGKFENPSQLLQRANQPEYRHLKQPLHQDIITLPGEGE